VRRALATIWLIVFVAAQPACGGLVPGPIDAVLDRGETLRVRGSSPTTLDPAVSGDSVTWSYLIQIYSGLVRLDQKLEIVPDLAERWELSPDGRTYTFTLRANARFHSGRAVEPGDFKYAMERALAPATKSKNAAQYLGDLVGAADVLAGRATELAGVQVVDARTLAIQIDAPKSYFLAKLSFPMAFALDRANVESGPEWFQRPNGTGPFKLGDWERTSKLTLLRFNQHWLGPARVRAVEFDLTPTPGIVLYERGDVDVSEVDIGSLERVSDPGNPLRKELVVTPLASTWYLGFNTSRPPFDDPAVRRAFAHATDRARLTRVYFRGTRAAAETILPPGLPGFNSQIRALPFDLDEAKRQLAASRYAGRMPEVILSVGEGSGATGEAFAEMYTRNLGIDVGVRELSSDYFGALERREAQMFFTGWVADYPDPENFLDILFHTGSSGNYGGFSSRELDTLLERARVEPDAGRRAELYGQAEQLILRDGAAIPIHHETTHALVRPYVKGLTYTPLGIISYRDVEVGERTGRRAA
jgi:oligopeptide transport system substrate-binding protein